MDDGWDYQRAIVAALNAEIGARGWTRKHLGESAGIGEQTMMRIFRCERNMNVQQLGAMVDALGVTIEHLAAEADRWSRSLGGTFDPMPTGDAKARIQRLINEPNSDEVLTARLSEIERLTGATGNELARLRDVVTQTRKNELTAELRVHPPSASRAHHKSS